jgi:hypothetical protein
MRALPSFPLPWDSNAQGWARYGKSDERMAQWLEDAQRQREQQSR